MTGRRVQILRTSSRAFVRWVAPPRPKVPISRPGQDSSWTAGLSSPPSSSSVILKEHNGDAPSSPGGSGRSALSIFEYFEKMNPPFDRKSFMFKHGVAVAPKNKDSPNGKKGAGSKKGNSKTESPPTICKAVQAGEDAFFLRHDAMGVADGVGGWSTVKNADPALYSRKLLHHISVELERYDDITDENITSHDYYHLDPRTVIDVGYENLKEEARRENILGSTTVLLVLLRDDRLRVANVGDCRMMLIRKGSCINTTFEQQHSFNFPFQLGTGSKDKALDAKYDEFIIQEGDIVILGTDGVWDNVFDDEIIEMTRSIASKYSSPVTVDPQRIANALLKRAREVAEDARQMYSPFQEKAIQEGLYYQGGKMDDITVAVGIVLLAEDSPDRR